jgi:DNA polymerase
MTRVPRATIDFETRSACDIKTHGSWRYSLDATTEVLCLAFRLPHWAEGRTALWHPAFPHLKIEEATCPELADLFQWIIAGKLVEAHNAFFERGIWQHQMCRKFGWPAVHPSLWRDSSAKAAAHALPRKLNDAAKALGLSTRKDPEGVKKMKESAIKRMFKPRKARKKERETWAAKHGDAPMPLLWWESQETMLAMFAYCRLDVLAEEGLSQQLPDLSDDETGVLILDQTINERGVRIDQQAVACALRLIDKETDLLNAELATVTDGAVTKATQRARLMTWLKDEGLELDNTQKQTVDDVLSENWLYSASWIEGVMTPKTKRALEILRELGKSSTAKYEAMRKWSCPDGRVHGSMLYHGATTGRWSGAGVQPHNFPKGALPKAQLKTWDMFYAWLLLLTEDREAIIGEWGSVMAPLSQGLRGAIIPAEGKKFYVADYAAIEARVLLWLAEDEEHLDIFRRGEDIYCDMAGHIYGYPCSKKDTPKERDLGKVAILGLGYQMGASKFVATAATYGIELEEDFAKDVVDKYREKFYLVKQLWWDQEEAAVRAVHRPGTAVICGRVTWKKIGLFLYATLPSGRRLSYPFPQVKAVMTPWGTPKDQLSYMGVNPYNHQWQRQATYGGMIVENLVQAISRDIMASALQRLEASGVYAPVLTVHDELVAEGHPAIGDVDSFVKLVATLPDWAEGLPLEAEGWADIRYHK